MLLLTTGLLQSTHVRLLAIATPPSSLLQALLPRLPPNRSRNYNHRPRLLSLPRLLLQCRSNRRHSQQPQRPSQYNLHYHRRPS